MSEVKVAELIDSEAKITELADNVTRAEIARLAEVNGLTVQEMTSKVTNEPHWRFVLHRLVNPDLDDALSACVPAQAEGGNATPPPPSRRAVLPFLTTTAKLENTLARHAAFWLEPEREVSEFTTDEPIPDVLGELTAEYTLGELGPGEMELVMWLLGKWDPRVDERRVFFTGKEIADDCAVEYGGSRLALVKDQLRRLMGTTFRYRNRYTMRGKPPVEHEANYSIIDRFDVIRALGNAPNDVERAHFFAEFNSFVIEQLQRGLFVEVDWHIFRHRLRKPLERRLYVFLESQKGRRGGRDDETYYTVDIDKRLAASLGSRVGLTNHSRFRQYLRNAGAAICEADPRYLSINIKIPSKRRAPYYLEVERMTNKDGWNARRAALASVVTAPRTERSKQPSPPRTNLIATAG